MGQVIAGNSVPKSVVQVQLSVLWPRLESWTRQERMRGKVHVHKQLAP